MARGAHDGLNDSRLSGNDTATGQRREYAAGRTLTFKVLTTSQAGSSSPTGFAAPGLLTEEEYNRVLATLDAEFSANAEAARAEESQLVVVARELGLSPEPSGEGPHHWHSRCPGTNHGLMISSSSDQFGCGYCKVKGGAEELREFVARRRE
jgi:hypothetical protein